MADQSQTLIPVFYKGQWADIPQSNLAAITADGGVVGVDVMLNGQKQTIPAAKLNDFTAQYPNAKPLTALGAEQLPSSGNPANVGGDRNMDRLLTVGEDLAMPAMGAAIGAAAGAPLGPPGMIAGGVIGGAGGAAYKHVGRKLTGRENASPDQIAEDVTLNAVGGGMQAAPAAQAAAAPVGKSLTSAQSLSQEFGVPLTKGQQAESSFLQRVEGLLRRTLGGGSVFQKFDSKVNTAIQSGVDDIANEISSFNGTRREVGDFIQKAITSTDQAASAKYGAALDQISEAGASDLPLNLKGDLRETAQKLINEIKLNPDFEQGLSTVQGRQQALNILESFTEPTKIVSRTKMVPGEAPSTILGENGQPLMKSVMQPTQVPTEVDKQLTFEEARRLRTQLFALANSGEITIGKGALKQFNGALDQAMQETLTANGRSDLAQSFRNASSNYKSVQDMLEQSTVARLAKSDQPEKIADVLLSKGAESDANTLRQLIGQKNMSTVERALWERLFERVQDKNAGTVVGAALKKEFASLGPEAQEAIWGSDPQRFAKIQRFVDLVGRADLKRGATGTEALVGPMLHSSMLTAKAMQAGASAVALDPRGLALHLTEGATVVITPIVAAKILTSQGGLDAMLNAAKAPLGSRVGAAAVSRLVVMMNQFNTQDRQQKAEQSFNPFSE